MLPPHRRTFSVTSRKSTGFSNASNPVADAAIRRPARTRVAQRREANLIELQASESICDSERQSGIGMDEPPFYPATCGKGRTNRDAPAKLRFPGFFRPGVLQGDRAVEHETIGTRIGIEREVGEPLELVPFVGRGAGQ